jgi:hypothetical protein
MRWFASVACCLALACCLLFVLVRPYCDAAVNAGQTAGSVAGRRGPFAVASLTSARGSAREQLADNEQLAEQIEKEGLRGRIKYKWLKPRALPVLLPAQLACYPLDFINHRAPKMVFFWHSIETFSIPCPAK